MFKDHIEEWRPVKDYEGWYEVSSCGRVRSVDRYIDHSKDGRVARKSHVLKPSPNTCGYPIVVLCRNGSHRTVPVHRLVSRAFVADDSDGLEVNHKNGIKTDNRACNLERVTRGENIRHAWRTGLIQPRPLKGESNGASKLTAGDVRQIRTLASKKTNMALAKMFGVTSSNIGCIIKRKSWAHI